MSRYPSEGEVVERGQDNRGEYVVTICTSMGEPTEYGSRTIEAFYDRKLRKPRLRVIHRRSDG